MKIKTVVEVELSPTQLGMMLLTSHEKPRCWSGRGSLDQARELVKLGMFEQDMTAKDLFRCTERGEEVLAELMRERRA